MHDTAGFTLIELLITIAIIGILIGVALPNLFSAQKRAYDTAAMSCANSLARAIQIYRVDHPLTSDVPGVADLYGDATKDEFYGTNVCSQLPASSVVTGDAATDGNYAFTIKHAHGKNTYLLTSEGISIQH